MSPPPVTPQHRFEYALLASFLWVVRWLPERMSLGMLRLVGRLGCRLATERTGKALESVERALGYPVDSPENRAIVRDSFIGMALQLGEGELLVRRKERGRSLDDVLTIEGGEHMQACLDAKRGVILAMGHFGAWECLPFFMREHFEPIWAVARSPDNPLVAEWMFRWRERLIQGTLDKSGGGIKLARLLRDGAIVGMLLDQNAGRQGVMLDFFGQPCWQHKVAGVLARRFDVAVLPTYVVREPGHMRFRLVFEAPIEPDRECGDDEAVEVDVVRRLSTSLEERVRGQPGQWLWLHDRWRRARKRIRRERRRARAAQVEAERAAAAGELPPGTQEPVAEAVAVEPTDARTPAAVDGKTDG